MRSNRGHTLIEVVLAILIVAVAFPPLLHWFAGLAQEGAEVDALPTAVSLASELMEEIKSRKFDELDEKDANGNWSTSLATDAGESATDKGTFDDVDDFDGWAQAFGGGFTDFTAQVDVSYVASNDLDNPLTIPGPVPDDWTPSYKYVVVTVSHPSLAADIQVTTVVTEVQSL